MFNPIYTITNKIAAALMRIEALRYEIDMLPINPTVLASLQETAHFRTIHYSTMIEGNRLTEQQVAEVIKEAYHFPGKERDEKEVLGYYRALDYMESLVKKKVTLQESHIKMLHGLLMGGGKKKVKSTPFRDGQNVIRDSRTGKIVYLPPETGDVPILMKSLVTWINHSEKEQLPCPLRAGIAHYQFATIHPYYDGNGRTARLLASLILHLCGYGLKGIYSLEEYYAKNLIDYYSALACGPSHNYYFGRAEADITPWLEYFCLGMLDSFEKVKKQALKAQKKGLSDTSIRLNDLDIRQRKIIQRFKNKKSITSDDIAKLLKVSTRTARALCQKWLNEGFIIILDQSKRNRSYTFSPEIRQLLKS